MANAHDWQTYFTRIDDVLASISVDMRAAADLPELDAPNMLRVQYVLRQPDEDGFPAPEEEAALEELRTELTDWIGALGGRLVGEASGNGLHDWFFYVPCGWLEAANLVHRIGLRKNVELGAEMWPDATHETYFHALLPGEDELRRTRNAEQLAELAALGDDARQPRPVVHAVAFDNHTQALACADWARRAGYVVEGMVPAAEGGHYRLVFHRVMPLDARQLDDDTHTVATRARRLGGEYVGWQAEVRLPKSA